MWQREWSQVRALGVRRRLFRGRSEQHGSWWSLGRVTRRLVHAVIGARRHNVGGAARGGRERYACASNFSTAIRRTNMSQSTKVIGTAKIGLLDWSVLAIFRAVRDEGLPGRASIRLSAQCAEAAPRRTIPAKCGLICAGAGAIRPDALGFAIASARETRSYPAATGALAQRATPPRWRRVQIHD
jgi:hypothetical protein